MGDGSLREPSPIRQGISGGAVKDKNRNPEGNPRFFPGRFGSGAGMEKINSQYVNINLMNPVNLAIISFRNRVLRPHGHPP